MKSANFLYSQIGHDRHLEGFLVVLLLFASPDPLATAAEPHEEYAHEENDVGGEHEHSERYEHEEGVVRIAPDILDEFGIEREAVGPGVLHETVVLPGEIVFHGEQIARVSPRYAGTVQSIEVRLADIVNAGQVLAVLESSETLRPFQLKAPISGTVVRYDVTPGASVAAGEALFTVADLSNVWADLQIYQRDLGRVREGQSVVLEGGHDMPRFRGTIDYVAPVVEEHTRTGLARVVVPNPEGEWKPGQFVKGRVTFEEHPVDLFIPRTSVLTLDGATAVFVAVDAGFKPRPVTLGHSDDVGYEVLQGLETGEIIATKNAISLKAELNRESFGGHDHAH